MGSEMTLDSRASFLTLSKILQFPLMSDQFTRRIPNVSPCHIYQFVAYSTQNSCTYLMVSYLYDVTCISP